MPIAYKHSYKRNLPHIQPPGATFFITMRLAGTLPKSVITQLQEEAAAAEKQIQETAPPEEQKRLQYQSHKRQFGRYDQVLDQYAHGPRWLQQLTIAEIVKQSLHYLDGKLVELDTYTVMGNHIHVILTPLEDGADRYVALPRILHSFKRFTAREANKLLGRTGRFWQHESYDHIVRNEAELTRIRQYILQNPVKAGLVDEASAWPHSWAKWQRR